MTMIMIVVKNAKIIYQCLLNLKYGTLSETDAGGRCEQMCCEFR